MGYVDAYKPQDKEIIKVVERVDGKRIYKDYHAEYILYYEDPNGDYRTMWNKPCKKITARSRKEFSREKSRLFGKNIHESDVNVIFRCLSNNYTDKDAPNLHIAFFDIETDFDPDRGFADPWDPFSRITAITVYQKWTQKLITFALKPDVPEDSDYFLTYEEADQICNEFDDCYLCDSEEQLLQCFLESIDDVDVLSGWNSTGYDIPYTTNRITRVMGKEYTKKLNAFDVFPRVRTYTKFKKEFKTYDLIGRVHMDYLDLYQKHNAGELSSYRLDYVGEIEVGERKVQYNGTLDMLYKKDFKKFIEYNRQDTLLLNKIDDKKKFIELANQIAHTNTVLLQTTMGSVALIEQAIINETHRLGMVAPNGNRGFDDFGIDEDEEDIVEEFDINKGPAVGAHVADPKTGLHSQIGCCDINSLYPSTIRSLNMGPETIIGQIRNDRTSDFIKERIDQGKTVPEAWHNVFCLLEFDMIHRKTDDELIIDFESGESIKLTASEIYDLIYNENSTFILSANCTIFDKTRKGVIPGLLEKWYSERKIMQKTEKVFETLRSDGFKIDDELASLLQ